MRKGISLLLALALTAALAVPAAAAQTTGLLIKGKGVYEFTPGSEYHATDLFGEDFKQLMPGDKVSQVITVKAEFGLFKEDSIKVTLEGRVHDRQDNPLAYSEAAEEADGNDDTDIDELGRDETVASMTQFLDVLTITVTNLNKDDVDTDDKILLADKASTVLTRTQLGTFRNKGRIKLLVELEWPLGMDYDYNQYAHRVGEIDWVFTVSAYDDPNVANNELINPRTGDLIPAAAAVMTASGTALAVLAARRRKKRQ